MFSLFLCGEMWPCVWNRVGEFQEAEDTRESSKFCAQISQRLVKLGDRHLGGAGKGSMRLMGGWGPGVTEAPVKAAWKC